MASTSSGNDTGNSIMLPSTPGQMRREPQVGDDADDHARHYAPISIYPAAQPGRHELNAIHGSGQRHE
ncbi:MAG: hypothetical protein GPOALKHO_000170 [Sodalis sp.]|nr:MAG: hypothetical protein GPOALKHO_000170 [Sodalis sp.]